jgi:hypothetical protein
MNIIPQSLYERLIHHLQKLNTEEAKLLICHYSNPTNTLTEYQDQTSQLAGSSI